MNGYKLNTLVNSMLTAIVHRAFFRDKLMRSSFPLLSCAFMCVTLSPLPVGASTLDVPSSGLEVSSASSYDSALVAGPLSVKASIAVTGETVIRDGGSISMISASCPYKTKNIRIDSGIDAEDAYTFLSVGRTTLTTVGVINESTSDARVDFVTSGGRFWWSSDYSTSGTSFSGVAGGGFVFNGVGSTPISFFLNNATRTFASDGTKVRFTGSADICFNVNGGGEWVTLTYGNGEFIYDNSGDFRISGNENKYVGTLLLTKKEALRA